MECSLRCSETHHFANGKMKLAVAQAQLAFLNPSREVRETPNSPIVPRPY